MHEKRRYLHTFGDTIQNSPHVNQDVNQIIIRLPV